MIGQSFHDTSMNEPDIWLINIDVAYSADPKIRVLPQSLLGL